MRTISLIAAILVATANNKAVDDIMEVKSDISDSNQQAVEESANMDETSVGDEVLENMEVYIPENESPTEEPVQEEDLNDLRNYQYTQEDWPDSWFYYPGEVLNSNLGEVRGPSGVETYYNLPMGGVIDIMRNAGYGDGWEYWVRDDGVKMFGDYIMVAADQSLRPLGTILKTTLGPAIVCDTGDFIYNDPWQIDIAVAW
ncbi:MAG: hypothetical protein HFJ17_00750 [Clostridia bacterium]|nr:hypothetical protein [Clostridia bacterium]